LHDENELDFINIDHQVFWMVYHLSFHETMEANKKINRLTAVKESANLD